MLVEFTRFESELLPNWPIGTYKFCIFIDHRRGLFLNSFLHCDHLSKVASKYSRPPDLIYPYYSISKGICSNQLRLFSSLSFSLYLLYIVITINIFHWTYAKTVPIQYSSEHVAQLYRNAAECSKTNPQSRLLTKLIACFRISGMCVKPAVFSVTSLLFWWRIFVRIS